MVRDVDVRRKVLVAGAAMALMSSGACSHGVTSSKPSAPTTASTSSSASPEPASNVAVSLSEWSVGAPASAPAGSVTFTITNHGPDETHELVIIQTDLTPSDLPTNRDGAVKDERLTPAGGYVYPPGIDGAFQIQNIAVGDTQTPTLDLGAGSYVLICNIVQTKPDGSIVSHYAKGMRTGFTVK
jgi:hypothetical protein